jgi:hypothetical protein
MKEDIIEVKDCNSCPFFRMENHGGGIKGNCNLEPYQDEMEMEEVEGNYLRVPFVPDWCPMKKDEGFKLSYIFKIG